MPIFGRRFVPSVYIVDVFFVLFFVVVLGCFCCFSTGLTSVEEEKTVAEDCPRRWHDFLSNINGAERPSIRGRKRRVRHDKKNENKKMTMLKMLWPS